jgi:hypothetical protein
MAVAVTNCRRDSLRDIVPSMVEQFAVLFFFLCIIGAARKKERASL